MPVRCLPWLHPRQIPLALALRERLGIEFTGAGTSIRGRAREVAQALGVEPSDDLRAALAESRDQVVLLMDQTDLGTDLSADLRAIRAAIERGCQILSLEPIPASALDAAGEPGQTLADAVRFVPAPRATRVWRECADVLDQFGPVRTAAVACLAHAPGGDASLGAQLFAALDIVHAFIGEPETIDAALSGPGAPERPGETLRGLGGDLTANLRFPDGRSATILASDDAGRFMRSATLIGSGGRLRVFDDGFEWIGTDGRKVDQQRPSAREDPRPRDHGIDTLADALARTLDPGVPPPPATGTRAVLEIAQAALLSARTGQPESPRTIRRMIGE